MLANPLKKNKINLADYPYEKDIVCRQLMAQLSFFEVDLLKEILEGSLKTTSHQLAKTLHVDEKKLIPSLEKLKKLKLFTFEDGRVNVDKEMRKYYESQISKFDEDFRPDLEFLRSLLTKVPIHVLPAWYAIPRTSDDIFSSIVERYLQTPRNYQRYLEELTYDFPHLKLIADEVFKHPELKVSGKQIMDKFSLSPETFEEAMLLLEFNLVCCLNYNKKDDHWEETITPFFEWREFLLHQNKTDPQPIKNPLQVERTHPYDFGFVQDITTILTAEPSVISEKTIKALLPHTKPEYTANILELLNILQLCESSKKGKATAESWLKKQIQEQASAIYRIASRQSADFIDRDLRETEKCLKRVMHKGWIYFEDFLNGSCAAIGENQPVSLVKKGKRWRYQLPEYSPQDKETIYRLIFKTLFQSGMTATGMHDGKPCFCVTPYGRMNID